jgi:hypothetical protein
MTAAARLFWRSEDALRGTTGNPALITWARTRAGVSGETSRTLPNAEFEHIPGKVRLLLRKAKALQLNLMELTGGRNPAARLITRDVAFTTEHEPP